MNNRGMTERRRRAVTVLIAMLIIIGFTIYNHRQADKYNQSIEQDTATSQTAGHQTRLAVKALGELAVKERVARSGYSRSQFGSGWATVDGCDMRNRILARDLTEIVTDEDGCIVLSGLLVNDPYTAKRIEFVRGKATSGAVQIDHVVALSDAWQKGAQSLTEQKREQFANDPVNLLAVDGPANMEKGDGDAAEWLPQKSYRCRYVARQIAIKLKYALWVTRAEYSAIKRTLGTCPSQVLPIRGS